MNIARPILKWAGGKTKLLPQLDTFFPASLEGRGYVEPFMGSGAVFFHLAARDPSQVTLLDLNEDLINVYRWARNAPNALIAALEEHDSRHNQEGVTEAERKVYYLSVRACSPTPGSLEAAARFVYLNKTCFNGLYRVNKSGRFNVPMGDYAHPAILDAEGILEASRALRSATLHVRDFRELPSLVHPGDFIYLDPPYAPISETSSFTGYVEGGFGVQDQTDLRDMLMEISGRCQWMLSNSSAPLVDELYGGRGLTISYVSASRAINSKGTSRGRVLERVITNYPVTLS